MYNKAILVGRLTADPELRQTATGIPVTSFSIACDRRFSNKETGERQTDFLDVVAWRNNAEFVCRYFQKGKLILVEGSIQVRTYVDKETGKNRRAWEIQADNCQFIGSKAESGGSDGGGSFQSAPPRQNLPAAAPSAPAPAYASGNAEDFAEIDDDGDLPF